MQSKLAILVFLIACLYFSYIESQTTNPDHYYDFSKIYNVNGYEYAMDMTTNDTKYGFSFKSARSIACSGDANLNGAPTKSAEGLYFNNLKQTLRIENANNVYLTTKFLFAVWVKTFYFDPYRDEVILSQVRYDNKNDSDPTFTFGIKYNTTNSKLGMKFQATMYNSTLGGWQNFERIVCQTTQINDGWMLLSVGLDNSAVSTVSKMYFRVRTYNNGVVKDNVQEDYALLWKQQQTDKQDIYLGSYCNLYTKLFDYTPFMGTVSKLYIWKSISSLSSDGQFDKYFFRQTSGTPSCFSNLVPCKFCSVGFSPGTSYSMSIACTTYERNMQESYIAYWDFNYDSSEYILDQSGNGYHYLKDPVNDIEASEIWRVFNQGYLFDYGGYVITAAPIILQNYNQFTVDAWIRKDFSGYYNPADNMGMPLLLIIGPDNSTYEFALLASDFNQGIWVYTKDGGTWMFQSIPNLLSTGDWYYVGVSFFFFNYNGTQRCQIRYTVNTQSTTASHSTYSSDLISISSGSHLVLQAHRSMFVNKIRMYTYGITSDEYLALVGTYSATASANQCSKLGTQSQCTYCPIETKVCLSTCSQNQYGDNCDNCHFTCGHCIGSTKNDCVYCSRTPSTSFVRYSQTFGNCTCVSGYFYDSTSDVCSSCDSHCTECFGSTQENCLTCTSGKSYFSPQTCVDTCSDTVITSQTTKGYYSSTETIGLVSFPICAKCHPYCSVCSGPNNGECSDCQTGYFLDGDMVTCLATCPGSQYGDVATKRCYPCDGTCLTCTGPSSTECLTCVDTTLVQQSGTCQAACNNGYYNDNQVCYPCHIACATCTSPLNSTCGSCNSGYYLEWLGFTCLSSCPSGTYADSSTNQCLLCHYSCDTCSGSGPDKCTKCGDGYLKRGSLCVTNCEDGEFIVNGECVSCDSKCSTCYGYLDTQCYSCNDNTLTGLGYYFFNNSCIETCPNGYYPDNFDKSCKPCKSICTTCTSLDYCTSCIYGPYQLNNGECTYFTCLDTQYRTIRPTLSCYDCDSTCQTCQGASKFDCLSCNSKYQLIDQQCLTCNDQPGMTEPIDEGSTDCVEICGDGFNYGQYECDDGNLISGDGCSKTCKIESGWNCTGGSSTSPDTCTNVQNPTPSIALINSQNQVYVTFDKEVKLTDNLDDSQLSVAIIGSQSSYQFTWKLNDEYKTAATVQTIILDLTLLCSLKGTEKLTLTFLNSKIYVDNFGNGIDTVPITYPMRAYEYIDPSTKAKLDAAGDSSMLATLGGMAINLAISLIFGGSIAEMWVMVNTIQLISLLPLMSVNWPSITILVFQKMLSSHGETTIIPNVFYDSFLNRTGSSLQVEAALNDQFSTYGWTVSNFIYLSGRKILIWSVIIIAYPIVWYMKKKYANKHKICRVWVMAEQKFRYTLLLRGVIMSYASMYLASCLNIFKMDFSTMENTVSVFFAIAFQIILVYLPIHLMNILQRNYEKVTHEKFMASYSTIIKEVDLSRPIRYMYYPVFLIRRVVFVLELVLFANSPKVQIACMSFTAVVMLIYIVIIKPQKQKIMIILTALGEFILLILHLITILLLDDDLPDTKLNTIGWSILAIVGTYMALSWVIVVVLVVIQMKQKYRDWKKKKAEKKKKLEADYEFKKWKKRKQLDRKQKYNEEKQNLLEKHQAKVDEYLEQKNKENGDQTQQMNLEYFQNYMQMYQNMNFYNNNNMDPNQLYNNMIAAQQQQPTNFDPSQSARFQSSFMIQTKREDGPAAGINSQKEAMSNTSVSFNYSNSLNQQSQLNLLQNQQQLQQPLDEYGDEDYGDYGNEEENAANNNKVQLPPQNNGGYDFNQFDDNLNQFEAEYNQQEPELNQDYNQEQANDEQEDQNNEQENQDDADNNHNQDLDDWDNELNQNDNQQEPENQEDQQNENDQDYGDENFDEDNQENNEDQMNQDDQQNQEHDNNQQPEDQELKVDTQQDDAEDNQNNNNKDPEQQNDNDENQDHEQQDENLDDDIDEMMNEQKDEQEEQKGEEPEQQNDETPRLKEDDDNDGQNDQQEIDKNQPKQEKEDNNNDVHNDIPKDDNDNEDDLLNIE